ncbi:MAG TPA: class I SAM-dependent methyltransferase [bacterium]|nr:class I SAM-dependent methyltransferase [bacterium]
MAFEDIMSKVQGWVVGAETVAALGAKLALAQTGATAPPAIATALDAVIAAAGLAEIDELPPPQQAMLLGLTRLYARQMVDVLDEPGREPGWSFTHPDILDGWGRGSMMVPPMIVGATPALADIESFLDVGTGVGLLACAAAAIWPRASIVGIDPWGPSLERAHANVGRASLGDRITLRDQRLADLEDTDAYDCAWVPTFFLTEDDLEAALPALVRAVKPGGWIVLGRMRTATDPLAQALNVFRTVRGGGTDLDPKRAVELLQNAGCADVQVASAPPVAPLELILGRGPD